jgi:hypothetical protein
LWTPDFPIPLAYLWQAYHRIRRRKGGNGFGVMPLEWSDIDAFNRLTGMALAPWEVGMIERLDDVFLKAMADNAKKDE